MALEVTVVGKLIGKTVKPTKQGKHRYAFIVGDVIDGNVFRDPEVLDYWTKDVLTDVKLFDKYELEVCVQGEIKQVTEISKI